MRLLYEEIQCAKHFGLADKWFDLPRDRAAILFSVWMAEGRTTAVKMAKDKAAQEIATAAAAANRKKGAGK